MVRQLKEFFIIFATISLSSHIARVSAVKARIIGGTSATIAKHPYIVQLVYDGKFFCGGTLISSTHVLTAAHCVKGKQSSRLTVKAGTSLISEPGVISGVSKILASSAFNTRTLTKDVAVLKLSKSLKGSNIKPIALSTRNIKAGTTLHVSGWGTTKENSKTIPNQLRTVQIKSISRSACSRYYRGKVKITNTMVCASVPGQKDACLGDSGGPAVCNGRLCGIVSWGYGCARRGYPGVYTDVSQVSSFIKNAMKQ